MNTAMKMNIAADDIYSNFRLDSGDTIATVECAVDDSLIMLVFTDDGRPYNPLEQDDPDITLSAEEREIGGLGIFMVKKTMDEVTYGYSEGWNRLIIKKKR